MRVASALLLGAIILLTTATPAAAAVVRQGETVTVGPDETIEDDLYAFAANVNIAGTVRGDVIAAGANISVDGTVTGNLMAAGSTVVVRGEVGGSVRAAGATVTVHGKVGGDIIATTGDLTILGTGRVGRDVFVQSGTLTMAGAIGRDLQAGGGMATLDGRVGHDVYAELASLRLTDRAVVDGSVFYTSEREATVAAGARIGGSVQRRAPERAQPQVPPGPTALFVDWLRGLVGLLLLGLLIVIFFLGFSRRAGEALVHRPWVSLGVGVGVLIGLPLLAVLLFILGSLVGGWWLGLVALAAYAVLLAVGVPVAAVGVGGALLRVFGRPVHVALALFVGLVVLLLVALVPILGAIVILLALLFGLGASTLAIVRGRRPEPAPA